jgi:hypothetical protein
MTTTQQENVL